MSSNYKFVDNPDFELPSLKCEPMKTYGFKRVTKAELELILERLQRKTYNAELYFGERFQRIPCPPRPPSTVCKRLDENRKEPRHPEVALSGEGLERLVRRLRTPTASILADSEANGKRGNSEKQSQRRGVDDEREKKIIEMISRPTTATRDKRVLRYADDPVILSYNQKNARRNGVDRPISRQEQSELVHRIQLETVASRGGKMPFCRRMPSAWKQSLAHTEISA